MRSGAHVERWVSGSQRPGSGADYLTTSSVRLHRSARPSGERASVAAAFFSITYLGGSVPVIAGGCSPPPYR